MIGSEAISRINGDSLDDSTTELLVSPIDAESVTSTIRVLVISVGETSSIEERIVRVPLKRVIKCVRVVCVE